MTPPAAARGLARPTCRFCRAELEHEFVDLGMSPPSQRHVLREGRGDGELFHPIRVWVCHACFLVQLEEAVSPEELFGGAEYGFSSSSSRAWLRHAERFVMGAVRRFGLDVNSRVVEIGSNDGCLLEFFLRRGIPAFGVEPAKGPAASARARGVPCVERFFGRSVARELLADFGPADLLVANNVLSHVPDLGDFVSGIEILLAEQGVATLEFPHLMSLVEQNRFDTISLDRFSYFSFTNVERILAHHGLVPFDVVELPTHGGSLRVYARHLATEDPPATERVQAMREREARAGMGSLHYYAGFAERAREVRHQLLEFLIGARRRSESVVGYGGPGEGTTLLNYCGIRDDLLDYTIDQSPCRQGRFTPGTRLPILAPERVFETNPDYLLILPCTSREEIVEQMSGIRTWNGRFVLPTPEVKILA